jgi:hypothetical protein
MSKISLKPGNMLYPLPAVMVSVADKGGNSNILTVANSATVFKRNPKLTNDIIVA